MIRTTRVHLRFDSMALIAAALILVGLTGCSSYEFGTNGPLQQANPQHEEELEFNPLTGACTVRHRSNDGHRVKIEEATYSRDSDGLKTVKIKNLETFEETVANRTANVGQIKETYNGIVLWSDSFWAGLDKTMQNAISAASPAIMKWIDANPSAAKDKATMDAMVMKFFQEALANQIAGP